ncbi:hypothetical protein LUZ60_008995 [Juncus effusus]|nr:hypothetical protein LUZ60_008995 [Juncus effusus]
MSFLLPKLSTTSSLLSHHAKLSQNPPTNQLILPSPSSSNLSVQSKLTALQERTATEKGEFEKPSSAMRNNGKNPKDEFYLNLGIAVRTLRDDMPLLFVKDLNYEIYRDDITFVDPLNTFQGIENYKTIFWALRFHSKLLFQEINLKILRIYQLSENNIIIKWEIDGTPRVPWETRGTFQGTSKYKLDRNGKIYEHKFDNLALNFPKMAVRGSVLDLVVSRPATCPVGPGLGFWGEGLGFWGEGLGLESCTWVQLYKKVKSSLEEEWRCPVENGMEGMISCCL